MSAKVGMFAAKLSIERFREAIECIASAAPSEALGSPLCLEAFGEWSVATIAGCDVGVADDWAQSISCFIPSVTLSVFGLEGTWSYSVFNAGEHVAAHLAWDLLHPVLVGDLPRAAELLGVPEEFFRRYCIGDPLGDVEESDDNFEVLDAAYADLETYRVFDGDRFPPWDEYGYIDVLARLGMGEPYPEPVVLKQRESEAKWVRGPRLDSKRDAVCSFDPVAFRQEMGIRLR